MKKGFLYMIVSTHDDTGRVHYFEEGELVECVNIRPIANGFFDCWTERVDTVFNQFILPENVVEIGEI